MCKHPSEVKKGNERLIYDQAKGAWRWDKEAPVAKLRKYPAAVSPAA